MRTAANATPSADKQKIIVAVTVACAMSGVLMQTLDTTIVNVALPYMQGSLSASRDQITWVLTSYIVMSAIFTAPVGWLANRYGTRRVFIAALAGFTVSSGLCGLSVSIGEVVIFRALQGFFSAALMPLSMSIMVSLFPPERRAGPMSIWGMGLMIGPILGPTLGGYLTDFYSWSWCFYVNIPVGVLAISGLLLFQTEDTDKRQVKFDWTGFAFLSLTLAAFQLFLDRGVDQDWFSSTEIITYSVLAGFGFYLFLLHMFTVKQAFIPRQILADRNLILSTLLLCMISITMMAALSLMPAFLQNVSNRPVLNVGLLLGPRGFGVMAAMYLTGKISNYVDPRYIMTIGMAVLAWSFWQMAHWPADIGGGEFLFVTVVQGIATGLGFNPLMVIGFATLPDKLRNEGTMFISLMRNISSAVGVSVASVILANSVQTIRDQSVAAFSPINQVLSVNALSVHANYHVPVGLAQLNSMLQQFVAPLAYGNTYILMFWISVAGLPVVWMFRRPDYSRKSWKIIKDS